MLLNKQEAYLNWIFNVLTNIKRVIKDRDYQFLEKNRRKKFQQTARNPLTEDRSKMKQAKNNNLLAQINKAGAEAKVVIKTEGGFVDPLSRLKSKPANPLARIPIKNPLMANKNQQEEEAEKPQQPDPLARKVIMNTGNDQLDPIKNEEQENQLWEIIRKEYVKTFDLNIRHLNGQVNNPFGSSALATEERKNKQVQQGSRYEQDKTYNQQKLQVQTIAMKTYIENLIEMHSKMRKKWNDQDKVGTLQITIQAIKLFADNDQPRFAPYKYVYIMDILDSFSKFVFQRMKKLSFPQYTSEKLKTLTFFEISGANIPESAQEICRNWLRKVSSIRELVPRIYIEAALLPIYYFIDSTKIQQNLFKLSFQSRCIGDYINSVNYSTFLLRIGAELLPKEKSHILQMLDDFFYYMKQSQFGQSGFSTDEYLKLFEPFLTTALRIYSENCSEQEFSELFSIYQCSNQHSEILSKIVQAFSPELIAKYSSEIFLILSSYHIDYKFKMYTIFLPKLSRGIQQINGAPIEICNLVWIDLKQVNKIDVFLTILVSFIELINKCFKGYQKTKIFQSIIEKFNDLFQQVDTSNDKNNQTLLKLEQFIKSILTTCDDIREILTIEPFLQFISFFPPQLKYNVSKDVLGMFMEREKIQKISDPIAVHSILQIAKNLNEGDKKLEDPKQIFVLLKSFFEKIDFGRNLEQMLNLYTEIRASFGHINEVVEYVINKVSNLTFTAKSMFTSQKMQKKITGFLQACVAFCYITIPMIDSPLLQFKYYYMNSSIALLHNLISQAESSFKTALSILVDLPEQINGKNVDELVIRDLSSMISFMVVLPDNPESDILHLYSGFISLLSQFKWSSRNGESYKLSLIKDLIAYLCIQKQENFPYHIDGVRSNDKLFVDQEFKATVVDQVSNLLYKIQEITPEIAPKSYDQQENRLLIRNICHVINTILMYIEPNRVVKSVLSQLLNVVNKKCNDLNRDSFGRKILDEIFNLIKQTLQNIEKNAKEVKDFQVYKDNINAVLDSVKKQK
ncbi:hypothetical protein ABPG72_020997 [Tetrahymena utriculariae]